jgi:hypothetical protein
MDIAKEQALETYKSMISIGTEALKALQLINGGAIVALLAYLGHAPKSPNLSHEVGKPLVLFVLGLVSATLAFLFTYLTQYYLFNDFFETEKRDRHVSWLVTTIVVALLSVAFFTAGSIVAVQVLTNS